MKERYDAISDAYLGVGAFGQVELVKRRSDQKTFACKTIFSSSASKAEKEDTRREYNIVRSLNHPNIVKYYDSDWTSSRAKLYMEYCEHGSLDRVIERYKLKGQMIPEYYIWSIVYQLASALCYCHEGRAVTGFEERTVVPPAQEWRVILHRDIKPKNVLVTSESMTALDAIKLGDFGLGVILTGVKDPTTYAGTKIYLPPEIASGQRFVWKTPCDIFSLGCTLFELYHLEPPFDDHAGSSVGHRSVRPGCPDALRDCIVQCLRTDPDQRPNAYEILMSARQKLDEKPEHFAAVRQHRLLSSSEQGDFETVAQLLEYNTPINSRDGTDEETSLHRAARARINGRKTSQLLLNHGADNSIKSKNGETPLHVAAEAGNLDVVKLLLEVKASTGVRDKRDWLPLHSAASQGHDVVVKVLIDMGADKDSYTKDSLKRTPLHIAAANGHYRTVLSLIESKAEVNSVRGDGGTVLHSAAEDGCVSIIAELLVAGVDLDTRTKDGRTALLVAAAEGHAEAVRYLLCAGQSRKNKIFWTRSGFKRNPQYGLSPVHVAALGNHAAVLDIALENDFAVNAPVEGNVIHNLAIEIPLGWTALHIASTLGHHEAVAVLLKFKANKEQLTKNLETALHLAAGCGHIEAAKCLIQNSANVEARAFKQFTPLHYSATRKQEEMVKFLLDIGADPDARTSSGATALHLAANAGHAEIVTMLMFACAHIDAVNDAGQTALHVAANINSSEVVRRLMRSRVDYRDKRDRRRQRAVDIAMERGYDDVIEALGGRR